MHRQAVVCEIPGHVQVLKEITLVRTNVHLFLSLWVPENHREDLQTKQRCLRI